MGLVADAPLTERDVARVIGPHLRRLDLQALAQAGAIELLDVEVRLTAAHETGPVVEATPAELQPDEDTGGAAGIPAPPPPCLHGHIWMTGLVGGSEQHLDPAD